MSDTKSLLRGRMAELRTEIESLLQVEKRAELEALNVQRCELDARIAALNDEINALEQPRLHEAKTELSAVAKALGALTLSGR